MIDKKALSILKKAKKFNPVITEKDREICRENGVLWEKAPVSHDELIKEIKDISGRISMEKAVNGFLYSISSGDCRYRTALSSLIWAGALTAHEEVRDDSRKDHRCRVCGCSISDESGMAVFDEMKYHSERLIPQKEMTDICCAPYVLCDLEYFETLPDVIYCDEDIRILNRILGLAGEVSSGNKVNALLALIAADESLSLTAADAYSVLGVLSSCGVFDTPEHAGYRSGFVGCSDRGFLYEKDIYYPLVYWRGKHGINYSAFGEVFGADIAGKVSPETAVKGDAVRSEKKIKAVSGAEKYFTDGEYFIDMTDRYRYYYGLSPIKPEWEKSVMYSVTHSIVRRTELFYEGDVIKKFIYEEDFLGGRKHYTECDTDAPTKNRELLLPKTERGRARNITPSLLQTPTYMNAHIIVDICPKDKDSGGVWSFNSSNDQQLPLPSQTIHSREDFTEYTEKYIASLPPDYDKLLDNFKTKKRRTVKFTAGDIFRIQTDVRHYTYCLILGKVRQLLKWQEVPEKHPLQRVMTQPIMYRQYAIITENADMTAEELEKIPLLPMQMAQDNEVLWETYPIVGNKKLEKSDIDLGFMTDDKTVIWGLTMHTFDDLGDEDKFPSAFKAFDAKTDSWFLAYSVGLSIQYDTDADSDGHIPVKPTAADEYKSRLTDMLGLDTEAPEDDFAERYGGITREQYIELAEKRFRK